MKKYLLILCCLLTIVAQAQNPGYSQKLYYACKVWGFVKYYHSGVSTCQVNWDSVLVNHLPHIKQAVTTADFNSELDSMLIAAGPMAIAPGILPDTIQPELKRNRNFGWINDPLLNNIIRAKLIQIKDNFRPHANCWVQYNTNPANISFLTFPHDDPMYNNNTSLSFPDERTRLLVGFRYWNIMNYFNPYNYVLDRPWDSVLSTKMPLVANASTAKEFYEAMKKISKELNDAHVEGGTYSTNLSVIRYRYAPMLKITHTQNQYIVVKSGLPGIKRGDVITSINGASPVQMQDSLRPFVSAGDSGVFYRFMNSYLLNGDYNTPVVIGYKDSLGASHTVTDTRTTSFLSTFHTDYYPNDSLQFVKWKTFGCGVGYVNMGKLLYEDVTAMYNDLSGTPAIIFDIRNYPNGTAWAIANLMYPGPLSFSKIMQPDLTYPGTFSWQMQSMGNSGNSNPYYGKVIILMNEETQSQAEYSCMILEALPDVVKVGSQTAGADGNVTDFSLSLDIRTRFTCLGVFYPNGDSTQRIGIVPDSVVYQTRDGIRAHRDEVLEKALQIAACPVGIKKTTEALKGLSVYPNPVSNSLRVAATEGTSLEYEIDDLLGKTILKQRTATPEFVIDVSSLIPGIYFLRLRSGNALRVEKFVKE